jgi:starvation-inducible DNA-binding protein
MTDLAYTIPGLGTDDSLRLVESLQDRLHAMNDLHLTLKHAHWNVTGPRFIAVHEMLDPEVYDGIIASNRKAITLAGELDPMTEDILVEQTRGLEKFQWFVRAHLEGSQA